MAETMKYQAEREMGCGFMTSIFHSRGLWKKKSSRQPLPASSSADKFPAKLPPQKKPASGVSKASRRPSDSTRSSTSSSNSSGPKKPSQTPDMAECRRTKSEPSPNISGHRPSDERNTLLRASSGNIMLPGHLGNLKQQRIKKVPLTKTLALRHLTFDSKSVQEFGHGNIVKSPHLRNKLDSEMLKSIGNEKYDQGKFEEALALYNRAISLDSNKASYHSNKAAALIGLGRLVEAVFACREAVRIEPCYRRAHRRLATLYLRLGEAERALQHYGKAGFEAGSDEIAAARSVNTELAVSRKAMELRDWKTLLKSSSSAISTGADSAPQIYAMRADALLKLHRHEEAYETFRRGMRFEIESCSRLFGSACSAYMLATRAQVYAAAGRFEGALADARQAARLDSSSEMKAMARRIQAVASARSIGNTLFRAAKFSAASVAYSEGLELEPYNSILLCNRAACRVKLGQFEKGAEDCVSALNVWPSYNKARLRRANCYAKLERWEAAIQDYEMVMREMPGDEEVGKALLDAQAQLKKQQWRIHPQDESPTTTLQIKAPEK